MADDTFQLVDADERFTSMWDNKSLISDSKGKVKVLIVDYEKLCTDREEILKSLKQWFTMAFQEPVDAEPEELPQAEDGITSLLEDARSAKDKLVDLHTDLIEFCQEQLKKQSQKTTEKSSFKEEERDELIGKNMKYQEDLNLTVMRLREAEAKVIALQKAVDRKADEISASKSSEGSAVTELKQTLMTETKRHRERETELMMEVDNLQKRLSKTQERLDHTVVDLYEQRSKPTSSGADDDADNMEELVQKKTQGFETEKQDLANKITSLERQLKGQELMHKQGVDQLTQKKDQEMSVAVAKHRQQHEKITLKMREDFTTRVKEMESRNQLILDQQEQRFRASLQSGDSQQLYESLSQNFNERLASMKDYMTQDFNKEAEELKKEFSRKEYEMKKELASKIAAVTQQAQMIGRKSPNIAHLNEEGHPPPLGAGTELTELQKKDAQIGALQDKLDQLQLQVDVGIRVSTSAVSSLTSGTPGQSPGPSRMRILPASAGPSPALQGGGSPLPSGGRKSGGRQSGHHMSLAQSGEQSMSKEEHERQLAEVKNEMERRRAAEIITLKEAMAQERMSIIKAAHERRTTGTTKNVASYDDERYRLHMLLGQLVENTLTKQEKEQLIEVVKKSSLLEGERIRLVKMIEASIEDPSVKIPPSDTKTCLHLLGEASVTDQALTSLLHKLNVESSMDDDVPPEKRATELQGELSELQRERSQLALNLSGVSTSSSGTNEDAGKLAFIDQKIALVQKELRDLSHSPSVLRPQLSSLEATLSKQGISENDVFENVKCELPRIILRLDELEAEVKYLRPFEAKVAELTVQLNELNDPARPQSPVEPADFGKKSDRKLEEVEAHMKVLKEQIDAGECTTVEALVAAQHSQNNLIQELVDINKQQARESDALVGNLRKTVEELSQQNEALIKQSREKPPEEMTADETEHKLRAEHLTEALKTQVENQAKIVLLEAHVTELEGMHDSWKKEEEALKNVVTELENSLKTKAGQAACEGLSSAMAKERALLSAQINDLQSQVESVNERCKAASAQAKQNLESELKHVNSQHEAFVAELRENFERRIAGLTTALTASIDTDMMAIVKEDNDAKISTANLINKSNIEKVKDDMRRMITDHEEALAQLRRDDEIQIQKMQGLLGKMRHECVVLMEEEKCSMNHRGLTIEQQDACCGTSPMLRGADGHAQHAPKTPGFATSETAEEVGSAGSDRVGEASPHISLDASGTKGVGGGSSPGSTSGMSLLTGTSANSSPVGPQGKSPDSDMLTVAYSPYKKLVDGELMKLETVYKDLSSMIQDQRFKEKSKEELTQSKIMSLLKNTATAQELILSQREALLQTKKSDQKSQYFSILGQTELQAKLADQAAIIFGLKRQHNLQQERFIEVKDENIKLKHQVQQLELEVASLEAQLAALRQQAHLQDVQVNALSRPHAVLQLQQLQRQQLIQQQGGKPYDERYAETLARTSALLTELVRHGAVVPAEKLRVLEDAVYSLDENTLDTEGKRRRKAALELLRKDKDLREQKVAMTFQSLREKFRLREIKETMAALTPNDRLAQALKR
eukprot:TRINITY_DN3262_c0_g1_i4.p1 TRINITY_DN3262_c0_g1~~TRINITY_DN3262_c0_g1_i4.p1  ORF type:complete len:1704 (+),score=526.97 TRINITY_DN3262_c0_g1_i4:443-5113(+)